jgi:hypothetical protein
MFVVVYVSRGVAACVLACFMFLVACGQPADDEVGPDDNSGGEALVISQGGEIPGEDLCGQEYSVCGYIRVPADLEGQPRSLAVSLYTEQTPTAGPDVLITQIDSPSLRAGELYPIRVHPFLDTGEYYLWIILYMDGGGSARPVNAVDYTGTTGQPVVFDGQFVELEQVSLQPATGW